MFKRLLKFIVKSVLWFFLLSILWVLLYKFVDVPYTPLMAIRNVQNSSDYMQQHVWVDLDRISGRLQLAVVCAEDQLFLEHRGFDYASIRKAYTDNKTSKKLRGGSTLSQQTAKNVFLWPGRNWLRKGLEGWFTFLIETLWTKERILEVYLNSIEMGEGVFGAQAAAQYWFNKNAIDLNSHEAAAIAAILPNPRNFKATPRTNYMERRKRWILRQMNNFGELNFDARRKGGPKSK